MPHSSTLTPGLHVLPGITGRADAGELSKVLQGASATMERLRQRAIRLARSDARAIHLLGENGCGKSRLAVALHMCGPQSGRFMVAADLRTLGDAAPTRLRGCLDRLKGEVGTVLLRHPSVASGRVQVQLASALEDLGNAGASGTRILTSSLIDLRGHGLQTAFSQVVDVEVSAPIVVPSLRERSEDLPELCAAILHDLCAQLGMHAVGISPPALAQLKRWSFRGNVAELVALLRAALCRATSPWVTTECLPPLPTATREERNKGRAEFSVQLPGQSLWEIEGKALACALAAGGGRVVRSAEILGITRHALRRKLAKHGLTAEADDGALAVTSSAAKAVVPRSLAAENDVRGPASTARIPDTAAGVNASSQATPTAGASKRRADTRTPR